LPQVLRAWHSQGHRALVFTQTQQMLDIVEKAVAAEGRRSGSGNSVHGGRTTNALCLVLLQTIDSHLSTSQAFVPLSNARCIMCMLSTSCAGYKYHRMDGSTAVVNRMRLMDDFNESPRTFAFLLTTKVGGIGVNLTGANRCRLCTLLGFSRGSQSSHLQHQLKCGRLHQE
jgi:Helicase conserved C-terminal domain